MYELYNGNCLEYIGNLPEKSIIVTDPPFNVGYHYKTYKDNMKENEYLEFLSKILGGGVKNHVSLFTIRNHYINCLLNLVYRLRALFRGFTIQTPEGSIEILHFTTLFRTLTK